MPIITVSDEELKAICEKFNCKQSMVFDSLSFKRKSSTAIAIRKYAIEELGHERMYKEICE